MSLQSWGIHWFRRDLRLAGNPALHWSISKHRGRVLGLFCFDSRFLSRPDFSHHRFAFFLKTLKSLQSEMRELGGELLVLDSPAAEALSRLCAASAKLGRPSSLSFNRDYEPYARARDLSVRELAEEELSLEVHTARDHLILEPDEICKTSGGEGSYYSVYTPFSRRWFETIKMPAFRARIDEQLKGLSYLKDRSQGKAVAPVFKLGLKEVLPDLAAFPDALERFLAAELKRATIPIPEGGSVEAYRTLQRFKPHVSDYQKKRDLPAVRGTSGLSLYLKNGSLTSAQVIAELGLVSEKHETRTGRSTFLKELCWREFYYHILWHRPDVESGPYLKSYEKLQWRNDPSHIKSWKEGLTGYPIVDAAMRELATTGWMHNRARMIVASFLTKDLLVDWRLGERYFMEQLLDGDLAPNNGGWQWAASTGCDPQPYFRIFNPKLQGEKFDPDGEYIKQYVPELRSLGPKDIHDPDPLTRARLGYPAPIVDHAQARDQALQLYKSVRAND